MTGRTILYSSTRWQEFQLTAVAIHITEKWQNVDLNRLTFLPVQMGTRSPFPWYRFTFCIVFCWVYFSHVKYRMCLGSYWWSRAVHECHLLLPGNPKNVCDKTLGWSKPDRRWQTSLTDVRGAAEIQFNNVTPTFLASGLFSLLSAFGPLWAHIWFGYENIRWTGRGREKKRKKNKRARQHNTL